MIFRLGLFVAIAKSSNEHRNMSDYEKTIRQRISLAKSSVVFSFSLHVRGNRPSTRNIKNGDFTTENAYDFEENKRAIFRLNFYNGTFFLAKLVNLDWLLESGRPKK